MSRISKGTLMLCAGWGIQVASGYVLNMWLARRLGETLYGTYGVIMALIVWIEVGVISGLPSAVQKFVSAEETRGRAILRSANRLQLIWMMVLFVLSFLLAPALGRFFTDPLMSGLFRVAILDIWFHGFFFIYMYLQNALQRFGRQALLISVYAVSRLLFVIGLVTLTGSVEGALIANIAGSAVGFLLGLLFFSKSAIPKDDSVYDPKILLRFGFPVMLYALAINLFPCIDLWMVKYFIGGETTGHYTAASMIARVPFFLFFGLAATVMPSISRAVARHDEPQARRTIQSAFRLILITLIPLIAFVLLKSNELMVLLFGPNFLPGGELLALLFAGFSLLAVFLLMTTIINADGRPNASLLITGAGDAIDTLLNVLLTPRLGAMGSAWSTTIAVLLACAAAGIVVHRRFGRTIEAVSVLRIVLAAAPVLILSALVRVQGIMLVFLGIGVLSLYGTLLILLGEVKLEEIRRYLA